jgi:hypothetical protein
MIYHLLVFENRVDLLNHSLLKRSENNFFLNSHLYQWVLSLVNKNDYQILQVHNHVMVHQHQLKNEFLARHKISFYIQIIT